MKTRRKSSNPILIMLIGCIIVMSGTQDSEAAGGIDIEARLDRQPVASPCPGEFPIVATSVFNDTIGPRKEDLMDVRACGFNLCLNATSEANYEKLLKCMDGSGLKLLMLSYWFRYMSADKTGKWRTEIPMFVNKYKDNPNVAGWNLIDEPEWNHLSELRKRYELLLETDPSQFVLINLVGMLSQKFTGSCKSLGAYADSIQNKLDMDAWCFDYYPIWKTYGKLAVGYEPFYDALHAYATKSKETGQPMWSFCQSAEYVAPQHQFPAATLPYMGFQIYSALAYGAQGIAYWTYWQRNSNEQITYLSALVNEEGNRLPGWYAAREINMQIRTLTPVFLGAEMKECRHTGNINMKGTLPMISDFGPIQELTNEKKGVLVSHLSNNGHDYLMIVNHDVEKHQRVGIRFKSTSKVERIEAGSDKINRKRVKGMQNISLSPGGYALFEWR